MSMYWFRLLIISLTLLSGSLLAESRDYELKDHPTLTFDNPSESYQIKLKGVKCTHYSFLLEKDVTISYIVKINAPLSRSPCDVYISLQDGDGFEITRKMLRSVVGNFKGDLKGNFVISAPEYQKICGSELFIMVK